MSSVKNAKQPFILIVYGPTGVGKTDFALKIAQNIPAEIINMDVGQFYTPLSIGTAKPDWRSEPIKHHLFDVLDKPENYTVAQYRAACLSKARQIYRQGKLPILVGGSGFYLLSLFFPPKANLSAHSTKTNTPSAQLWQQLHAVDPVRAKSIDKNDGYRIERALAIWQQTGNKPSTYAPHVEAPGPFHLVFLSRDRKDLYDRINHRVVKMIDAGWLDEVSQLQGTDWEQFIQKKRLIGYNELLDYLNTKKDLTSAVRATQRRTRQYAKRQYTFWRMIAKSFAQDMLSTDRRSKIESVDLTFMDLDLYIKQLSCQLARFIN